MKAVQAYSDFIWNLFFSQRVNVFLGGKKKYFLHALSQQQGTTYKKKKKSDVPLQSVLAQMGAEKSCLFLNPKTLQRKRKVIDRD